MSLMSSIYHEKQSALLCGRHTLNSILQGPALTDVDLASIAQTLDAEEARLLSSPGGRLDPSLAGGESQNVSTSGNFSITVIERALSIYNISLERWTHPSCASIRQHPETAEAFVCHLSDHWFALRKVAGRWYNLNSLFPAPSFVGDIYLGSALTQLSAEGWSIFVVMGDVARASVAFLNAPLSSACPEGRRWTHEEAAAATRSADDAKKRGEARLAYEQALEFVDANQGRVVTLRTAVPTSGSLAPHSPAISLGGDDEDEDLARALAASREDAQPHQMSEDEQLARALAASCADR